MCRNPEKAEFFSRSGRHSESACYFLNGIGGKLNTVEFVSLLVDAI